MVKHFPPRPRAGAGKFREAMRTPARLVTVLPPSLSFPSPHAVSMEVSQPAPLQPSWQTQRHPFMSRVHLPFPLHRPGHPSGMAKRKKKIRSVGENANGGGLVHRCRDVMAKQEENLPTGDPKDMAVSSLSPNVWFGDIKDTLKERLCSKHACLNENNLSAYPSANFPLILLLKWLLASWFE